ncbi:hypothetical protein Tco_1506316 [Tanacetum coccineum]
MRETVQNKFDRETRFNNEFDQFVAEPEEALVSVYNRFAQLMNDLERNGIIFPKVTINTKFLNCLQPEWLKYVTQVRLAKRLTEDSYDDLFDYLQQFEKLVNASRAKKLEKSHDPLALVAHTGSSSRTTTPYYVTHPSSVYPKQPKIVNNIIGDDQIDSNIIFDEPNDDVNISSVEDDNNAQQSYELEQLARNAYKEAEKQQMIAKKVQQQNTMLTKQLESYKEKNEDVVLKMGNSLQGMFMLGPKPMSFYDSKVKHGLRYTNPSTLKKAISQNPKLYDASCLDDSKIQMNVRDIEDILDDATKSQFKMKRKSQDPIAIEKKQNV